MPSVHVVKSAMPCAQAPVVGRVLVGLPDGLVASPARVDMGVCGGTVKESTYSLVGAAALLGLAGLAHLARA